MFVCLSWLSVCGRGSGGVWRTVYTLALTASGGVTEILESLSVNPWRYFERIKSTVLTHQARCTVDLTTPPPPNTGQVTCGANCIFPCQSLSTSYQAVPVTSDTVVLVPSLVNSLTARGCCRYTDCEFLCHCAPFWSPTGLSGRKILPFSPWWSSMALTQIYPLFKNYFSVLLPCHFP